MVLLAVGSGLHQEALAPQETASLGATNSLTRGTCVGASYIVKCINQYSALGSVVMIIIQLMLTCRKAVL
jgi:hypothetical protein